MLTGVDSHDVNLDQLTLEHRQRLEILAREATGAAAVSLGTMLGVSIEVGYARLELGSIADTARQLDDLPTHMTAVYVQAVGNLEGQLMLLLPGTSATALVHTLAPHTGDLGSDRAAVVNDVLGEVGNIVLTGYLNELVKQTGLSSEPSPPMVAHDQSAAIMQLPLSAAASDRDVVVQLDAGLTATHTPLQARCRIVFLPAPGSLTAVLDQLDRQPTTHRRIPVRMGELAVSRQPGEVLVASGLGSCVAVALVDQLSRVAALAHIMLPQFPGSLTTGTRQNYAARYADSAIPALVDALERAGGRRVCARAYIAGGSQMFSGSLAENMDIPVRNVQSVRAAIQKLGINVHGDNTGGSTSRELEINVADMSVHVRCGSDPTLRLDAA